MVDVMHGATWPSAQLCFATAPGLGAVLVLETMLRVRFVFARMPIPFVERNHTCKRAANYSALRRLFARLLGRHKVHCKV
jgi:hypothetical protein